MWFSPSQQLSTTQLLAYSSPGGVGRRMEKERQSLVGWGKDSLLGQQRERETINNSTDNRYSQWVITESNLPIPQLTDRTLTD